MSQWIEFQTRPIDQWPRAFTKKRKRATFTKMYGTIMTDLKREIGYLRPKSVVLLMALEPEEIRNDGRPRANAHPKHPGVILVVETADKGTLRFPCDAFDDWVDNVRAITLHLDALRRIDRYGVNVSGEQYTGWARLEPPQSPGDEIKTYQDAKKFLERILGRSLNGEAADSIIRAAEIAAHPDKTGGDSRNFKRVQKCRQILLTTEAT